LVFISGQVAVTKDDTSVGSADFVAQLEQTFRNLDVAVVDGCIPSDLGAGSTSELEEERRLLYVAMTRAKDDLHLVLPHRFFTHGQNAYGDRHVYASRTRFIPAALLPRFESTTWPSAGAAGRRPETPQLRIDVGARMRAMWR